MVWAAQSSILFTTADILLVPMSLFWIAIMAFMFIPSMLNGTLGIFFIFSLFFLAWGLYFTVGRFLYKRSLKKRTLYALTDKRVIEITTGRTIKKRIITYSQISNLNCTSHRNNNGSITFGGGKFSKVLYGYYNNTGMEFIAIGNAPRDPAFYDVDNADVPASIIKEKIQDK